MLAIEMYLDLNNYKEILCELHEDILGVLKNDKFAGIQIKTRNLSLGPFRFTDEAMYNTLKRFVNLEEKFSSQFESYVIVSNCGFSTDSRNSILHLVKQSLLPKSNKFDITSTKFIKKLSDECNVDVSLVIRMLQKLECKESPGLNDISDVVENRYLKFLQKGSVLFPNQFHDIFVNIIQMVQEKSMVEFPDVIPRYSKFLQGVELKTHDELVNAKRITKETMQIIFRERLQAIYLKSREPTPYTLTEDSIRLMKRKMNLGGIDELIIQNMENLAYSAEEYAGEELHKWDDPTKGERKIDHILAVIQDEASGIRLHEIENGGIFGTRMLSSIDASLKKLSEDPEVFGTPHRILKGFAGILTASCKIAFSKIPEGGFK